MTFLISAVLIGSTTLFAAFADNDAVRSCGDLGLEGKYSCAYPLVSGETEYADILIERRGETLQFSVSGIVMTIDGKLHEEPAPSLDSHIGKCDENSMLVKLFVRGVPDGDIRVEKIRAGLIYTITRYGDGDPITVRCLGPRL